MMLVDPTKPLMDDSEEAAVFNIQGEMNYFPLCCSTGILEGLQANPVNDKMAVEFASPRPVREDKIEMVRQGETISDIVRTITHNRGYIAPKYFARWYAMDLMRRKLKHGHDKHGHGAYSGFKAAQITMFDRLLEDKDPAKGFKFTYNMTYSVCHLMEWLKKQGSKYGEVLVSEPVPGAHGARVYGCIFTGDVKALDKYCKERIEVVRDHYMSLHKYYVKEGPRMAQAATMKALPDFVTY